MERENRQIEMGFETKSNLAQMARYIDLTSRSIRTEDRLCERAKQVFFVVVIFFLFSFFCAQKK